MKLYKLTINKLQNLIKNKEISCTELLNSVLDRIDTVDKKLNSYITICKDSATQKALEVDLKIKNGESLPPLAGIPVGIKDLICTKGINTTCGSKMLESFKPPYDATVMESLYKNDAVMVGKLNMDEFAMGSSNESSYMGQTKNPWDLEKVPGGSSGGSAAAVAADEAIYTLGSDTGGSIRQPASFCGVVGMKPTYGSVSRYGLIAYASSLDQIGAFTKDVTDCAIVLNSICGYDKKDSTSANVLYPDYAKSLGCDIKGLKVAVPKEYFGEGINPDVKNEVMKAILQYEKLGAICEEVSLSATDYAIPAYYIIASAEASSNLARYDGVKYGYRTQEYSDLSEMYRKTRSEGFGTEVKRRIMLGTFALSSGYYDAYYKKAQKVRTVIINEFNQIFSKYDVIACPVSPVTAFKLGEKATDPLSMYLADIYTVSVNIAGLPAMSIPCGFDNGGMPIGLQLIGKAFSESTLLKAAFAFEQSTDYHTKKPSLN